MKKVLFLMIVLVTNIYPMVPRIDIDIFEGNAQSLTSQLKQYCKYMPSTGTIEIHVKKTPLKSKILTLTHNQNTKMLEFICNNPYLAPRVTKISFEEGSSVAIPPCIGKLVNLKSLILRGLNLKPYGNSSWRMPSEIANLTKLETLDLRDNGFFPEEKTEIKKYFENKNVNIQF